MAYTFSFRCPMPLLPMENGQRFCNSCERTVTDLCGMPEMDAKRWLEKNAGSACVRARVDKGGQLWAGALLLGTLSGPVGARDEIEGDMVEEYDSGVTRYLVFETDEGVDYSDIHAFNQLLSMNPGPFRILLQHDRERQVRIRIGEDRVAVGVIGADEPLTPRQQAAIEQIQALPWPNQSVRLTVHLRH